MTHLIYIESGEKVNVGDMGQTNDGSMFEVLSITEPHKPGSTGRVYVEIFDDDGAAKFRQEYFPTVIGAGWVERTDGGAEVEVVKDHPGAKNTTTVPQDAKIKNGMIDEVLAILTILDRTWIAARTTNTTHPEYATWEFNDSDGSSNLGHYNFASLEEATANMVKRATGIHNPEVSY